MHERLSHLFDNKAVSLLVTRFINQEKSSESLSDFVMMQCDALHIMCALPSFFTNAEERMLSQVESKEAEVACQALELLPRLINSSSRWNLVTTVKMAASLRYTFYPLRWNESQPSLSFSPHMPF